MIGGTVQGLAEVLDMKVLSGEDYLYRKIVTTDISRPGLELTGYFNYYPAERVQLFGLNEHSYMETLSSEERLERMREMAQEETPCFVFSRELTPAAEVFQVAEEMHIPILSSATVTTQLLKNITSYLQETLSLRQTEHGVFVDVYGVGILITGDSGIGKSETALELIKHGHRLVADDRVDFHKRDEHTVIGKAPEILRNMIEIRGLGIINVFTLFGAGAVRTEQQLNMIVNLIEWDSSAEYDRLGSAEETIPMFDVAIPRVTVPIRTGRNSSNIVEVAAMNYRAKRMGFNSEQEFEDRLTNLIARNTAEDEAERNRKQGS